MKRKMFHRHHEPSPAPLPVLEREAVPAERDAERHQDNLFMSRIHKRAGSLLLMLGIAGPPIAGYAVGDFYNPPIAEARAAEALQQQEREGKSQEEMKSLSVSDFHGRSSEMIGWETHEVRQKLSGEALRAILLETFPRRWVEGELEVVEQRDENHRIPPEYGVSGVALAMHLRDENKIVYWAISKQESIQTIIRTLFHEVAHANDPDSDRELDRRQADELHALLKERVVSEDRFPSPWVESIHNEDKYFELEYRASEYWAVICEQYFDDPSQLNARDIEVIERFIAINDPAFDVQKARERREELLQQSVLMEILSAE